MIAILKQKIMTFIGTICRGLSFTPMPLSGKLFPESSQLFQLAPEHFKLLAVKAYILS